MVNWIERSTYSPEKNRLNLWISDLIKHTLRQKGDHSRWATIRRLVSTHNYSTIQLPTTKGTVINVRKAGVPEAVHIDVYSKLGIDYKNLPIKKNLA